MTEHWQIFGAIVALVAGWSVIIIATLRTLLQKSISALEGKIAGMGDIGKDYQRVERALLELRAELPLQYVRREDAIRQETVINAKLDTLAAKIDTLRTDRGEKA